MSSKKQTLSLLHNKIPWEYFPFKENWQLTTGESAASLKLFEIFDKSDHSAGTTFSLLGTISVCTGGIQGLWEAPVHLSERSTCLTENGSPAASPANKPFSVLRGCGGRVEQPMAASVSTWSVWKTKHSTVGPLPDSRDAAASVSWYYCCSAAQ